MKKLFLVSVATAALVGANGFAIAQGPSEKPNPPAAQSAPSEKAVPAEKTAPPMNRTDAPAAKADSGMKGGRADQATPSVKGSVQHSQEINKDAAPSKGAASQQNPELKPTGKTSADMKSNGQHSSEKSAADTNAEKTKDGVKAESKSNAEAKPSTTTGQAGAGSKQMTSEQRTSIRTVIKQQNARPVTNVNFSISVGTRVPRTVSFYPVPTQLVAIYPDWRGYEYFLVGDQIIVVNPRTLEIVAVLEA